MFHDAVGESLKSYTTRLKLEKAAFGITYWDMKLTDIQLELGLVPMILFLDRLKIIFMSDKNHLVQLKKYIENVGVNK